MGLSLLMILKMPQPRGYMAFAASTVVRLVYSVGLIPTLWLLGALQLLNKIVFLVGFLGNRGIFYNEKTRTSDTVHLTVLLTQRDLLYHIGYLTVCCMGMFVHEFFYSVLVTAFLCQFFYVL